MDDGRGDFVADVLIRLLLFTNLLLDSLEGVVGVVLVVSLLSGESPWPETFGLSMLLFFLAINEDMKRCNIVIVSVVLVNS